MVACPGGVVFYLIVPATNIPLLLGLDLPPQEDDPVKLTYQQLSLATPLAKERFYPQNTTVLPLFSAGI